MDGRPTRTDCDESGDYVVPNVLSPRDLVSRPDIMDETVPHTSCSVESKFKRVHFDSVGLIKGHNVGWFLLSFFFRIFEFLCFVVDIRDLVHNMEYLFQLL